MLPPVERSITVSAPRSTAILSLASSLSMSEVTAELPMLALILHLALMPIAHRLEAELEVDDVGGDDHPAARHLVADQLGFQILAPGDELHLGRDDALTRLLRSASSATDLLLRRSERLEPGTRTGQRRRSPGPDSWSSGKPYPRRPTPRRSIRPRRVGSRGSVARRPGDAGRLRSVVPVSFRRATPSAFQRI